MDVSADSPVVKEPFPGPSTNCSGDKSPWMGAEATTRDRISLKSRVALGDVLTCLPPSIYNPLRARSV